MVVLNAEQMSEMQLKLSTLPVLSLQSCSKSTCHGPFTLWNTTTTPNVRIKERDSEHQKPSTKLVQEFGNHM